MYYVGRLQSSCKKVLTKIKDVYEMVQTCRVLHSRKQWKRKAMKRGAEIRELRKTVIRKNEQIDRLKFVPSPEASSDEAMSATEASHPEKVKKNLQ